MLYHYIERTASVLKHLSKAILTALFLSFIFTQIFFNTQCEDIPNHVIRLHILANSDSEQDQSLKIKLRDYILYNSRSLFEKAENKREAEHIVTTNLDKILKNAQGYVNSLGYDYKVSGKLEDNVYFSTRRYESFTLPAGNYTALRITIGKGQGHNWWCVMFPPLCFSAAEKHDGKQLSDVLSEDEYNITQNSEQYEYKFKIAEIYNDIKNFIKSHSSR